MQKIGLWQIIDGVSPSKIQESSVDLEKYIEGWIETNPDLLQLGLTIIGRQIKVEGGIIDLLAMDSIGRLVVIEVIRGMLRRETIAQIIDYASSVAIMSKEELCKVVDDYLVQHGKSLQKLLEEREAQEVFDSEPRELLLFVVGTGKAPGLERIVTYLSDKFQMPISLVSYDVFELKRMFHPVTSHDGCKYFDLTRLSPFLEFFPCVYMNLSVGQDRRHADVQGFQ